MFDHATMERTPMRFARLGNVGTEIPVVLDGDVALDLRSVTNDVDGAFLASDGLARTRAALDAGSLPQLPDAGSLRVGAPIARPSAVYCIGMNYAAHAAESGSEPPKQPIVTSIGSGGDIVEMVRRRRFPIIGNGAGVWSFIHLADAAAATVQALEGGENGVYNIVDDEPAPVRVWLPELALILDARPPIYLPEWIARLLVGESVVSMMTRIRGSSNEKARRLLGWRPIYTSWREGFRKELGQLAPRH